MAKRIAKCEHRDFTLAEKTRWELALKETEAEREEIINQGRAVLAARQLSQVMLGRLKAERERRGLSLADMMRLTGMSRESISRLENDPKPNPTMLTLARYATALGLDLQLSAQKRSPSGT